MTAHVPLTDAQRAMASALLWHFEDEDVRTENMNMRDQLNTMQQEMARLEALNRELIQKTAAVLQERESARLEAAAWREYMVKLNGMMTTLVGEDKAPPNEKLDDTIIRRIRICCLALQQITATCKNLMAENQAVKARIAGLELAATPASHPEIISIPPSRVATPSSAHPDRPTLVPSEVQPAATDRTPRQQPLAIDVNVPPAASQSTTSSEVSIPLASTVRQSQQQVPTPEQSSPAGDEPQPLPPPDSPPANSSPRPKAEPQSPTIQPQTSCTCPTFTVVSPSQRAELNSQEEPARARNWLEEVFSATDVGDATTIAQAEMYNAYRALDKERARAVLRPPEFFALLKTVFPASKCVQHAGPGGAYVIRGVTRRKAPCVCGLREP